MLRVFALATVAAMMAILTACGGGDSDPTPAATVPGATPGAAATVAAGEECDSDSIPGLGSTSHEVNVATTEQVIEMAWEAPETAPAGYEYAFSQNPQEPPEQRESLAGDATSASSGPMGQNRWYFYLLADGAAQPVRCGPYVIERAAEGDDEGSGGGSGDTVALSIAVAGGSSVEYFTNQGDRLFCGDTSLSGHDVTCSAEFVRGSEARIQRTLSLSDEEEARWRLSSWGGDCDDLDADVEPRGGQCILLMDDDKDVSVGFEQRPTITVTHAGPSQLLLRWSIEYQPAAQKGGGNPLTLRGTFDCDTDTLDACTKMAYFDAGTTVILRAGTGVDAPNFASWGGACSGTESTCELVLEGDAEVTFTWRY